MRRILILIILLAAISSKARESDHFRLFTDRDIYVSGETVLFKLYAPQEDFSSIVKVALINTSGKIITEVSKKLIDQQTDGFILLPDSLKTGTYLLCTSSGTTQTLTIRELLICNRFTGFSETTSALRAKGTEDVMLDATGIQMEGIGLKYKTRETAHVQLHVSPEMLSQLKDNLFVAVTAQPTGYQSQEIIQQTTLKGTASKSVNSIAVEGIAKDMETGVPFKNGCIYLSIPDSVPGLNYFITGEDGRFSFQLDDYYGKIPLVIQAVDVLKKRLVRISIDRHDSLTEGLPEFENRTLPADLLKTIANQIEAATLSKIFNYQELKINAPTPKKKDYPFYGIPTEVVRPAQFVDLPDFTEISRELLPGVKFRAYNRIPTIQILNPSTLNYYIEQPLVLLDGIPVQDLNVIKSMGTKDISRIEIGRKERFFGDLSFAGVIAIYSTQLGYEHLAESNELVKYNLDAIQPDAILNIPANRPANEPDLRKVLVWKPSIKSAETIQIDFESSDIQGNYQLILRGKTKNGNVISKVQNFEVY
ncbi:MAG: hypothetical protein WCP08_09685 [Prolixibacteraceae bacterium]